MSERDDDIFEALMQHLKQTKGEFNVHSLSMVLGFTMAYAAAARILKQIEVDEERLQFFEDSMRRLLESTAKPREIRDWLASKFPEPTSH